MNFVKGVGPPNSLFCFSNCIMRSLSMGPLLEYSVKKGRAGNRVISDETFSRNFACFAVNLLGSLFGPRDGASHFTIFDFRFLNADLWVCDAFILARQAGCPRYGKAGRDARDMVRQARMPALRRCRLIRLVGPLFHFRIKISVFQQFFRPVFTFND